MTPHERDRLGLLDPIHEANLLKIAQMTEDDPGTISFLGILIDQADRLRIAIRPVGITMYTLQHKLDPDRVGEFLKMRGFQFSSVEMDAADEVWKLFKKNQRRIKKRLKDLN